MLMLNMLTSHVTQLLKNTRNSLDNFFAITRIKYKNNQKMLLLSPNNINNNINILTYFFTTYKVRNTVNAPVLENKNKHKGVVISYNVNYIVTTNKVTTNVNDSKLKNKNKTVGMMAKLAVLVLKNGITPRYSHRNSNRFKYYFQVSLFPVFPTYSYQVDILCTLIQFFFLYTVFN